MRQEQAEVVALRALEWLVGAELLDTFQATTGAERAQIVAAAEDADFLGAVLDFILMQDDWVEGACAAQSLPYDRLLAARAALPGGNLPHWT
ncbi:DUF3572 family protein [uncultured Jannaschia sp.]|uniref:DUF3572 family protein n=1 Tax=Jannaschia halovivens TaxID=3388667 RepID=UPI00262C635D|nr:DUF3572 family protein [uncultured Jannaschia sp.]